MIRYSTLLVIVLALVINCLGASIVSADETNRFQLSLSLVEEYNDNLYETRTNHQADFISRVIPGVSWNRQAAHWNAAAQYRLEYVDYAFQKHNDELNHYLNSNIRMHLLNEFFFLDISDNYSRISLDDNTGTATQNLFTRQTNQNFFTISPYLLWRTTPQVDIKTGYRYQNQIYSNSTAIDWQGHSAFVEGIYSLTPKLSTLAGIEFMHTIPGKGDSYDRSTAYAGFNYELSSQSRVALRGGYSLLQFSGGTTQRSPYWNAELVHTSGRNTAILTTGVHYQADPESTASENRFVRGRLQRDHGRGIIGTTLAYNLLWKSDLAETDYSTVSAGIDGTYEHTTKLSSHTGITSIWYRDDRVRPCRLLAGAGLKYALPVDLSLTFDYELISNREQLSGGDATYTNRLILALHKVW